MKAEALTEAVRLMRQALALLDEAGEFDAAPHLDYAIARVTERLESPQQTEG